MYLSDTTIRKYIQLGKIEADGTLNIETLGISAHLNNEILIPSPDQKVWIDKPIDLQYTKYNIKDNEYVLKPNEFVLASTIQSIKTDKDIITFLDGRSSLARIGMTVHISATVLDGTPFNKHNIVLEIKNLGNFEIVLRYGDKIGTIYFAKLLEPIEGEKDSQYTNQNGVLPPKFDNE